MRRFFRFLNKYFMVPIFRLGLGPIFGNPLSGYIMVLKVIGRKTGKLRYAPVNYAIENGNIYCVAGFGRSSDWYRNLKAGTNIEAILPTGSIFGSTLEVPEISERRRLIRKILKNSGFAGYLKGFNHYTITDEQIIERTIGMPLIRILPSGPGNGAGDPGGWAWVWGPVITILTILGIWVILR
jgi:deazaflavin-dependent oxidoreductase (nitroreductase family)